MIVNQSSTLSFTTTIMTVATENSYLTGAKGRNTRGLLRLVILCTIAAAAVSSRLFSVISMYMCSSGYACLG
jgi:hypothetical protein